MNYNKILIILRKEYLERVAKRSFIIATLLTPVLILAIFAILGAVTYYSAKSDTDTYTIALVDDSGFVADNIKDSKKVTYTEVSASDVENITNEKNYSAIIFIGEDIASTNSVKMEKLESATMYLESAIKSSIKAAVAQRKIEQYDVENLSSIMKDVNKSISIETVTINVDGSKSKDSSELNYFMGYAAGFLIYMFTLIYGAQLLTSVVDEKNSKVVEVMISTVSPESMLMGKVIGVGLVALTQIAIWGSLVIIGGVSVAAIFADQLAAGADAATAVASSELSGTMTVALTAMTDVWAIVKNLFFFIVYFVGGYLIYASLFAAVGSAVSSVQDAQNLQTPIMIPIIGSLVFMSLALSSPDLTIVTVMSIFPLTSPIIMLSRIGSDVPMWEIVTSIVVLYGSLFGVVWIAGRIYRIGIMTHGQKPSFKQLYQWIRQK